MNRSATKEKIIRTTQELIVRDGIRAVRIYEIAQMLGISKRTLYEVFDKKTDLINICLDRSIYLARRRILLVRQRHSETPIQKLIGLLDEFTCQLCTVDAKLLSEVRTYHFNEHFGEYRNLWEKELAPTLLACRKNGFLSRQIDPAIYGGTIVSSAIELRIAGILSRQQQQLLQLWIRGIATRKGIDAIDRRQDPSSA